MVKRKRNSRAGRPAKVIDVTPDRVQQLEVERDTYKWLLLNALRHVDMGEVVIPSHELRSRLALEIFDVAIQPTPDGGVAVTRVHKPGLPIMGVPASRRWLMTNSEERVREEQQKRINEPRRVAQVDRLAADLHVMGIDDREVAAFLNRMGWTKRDDWDQIVTQEDWKLRRSVRQADEAKAAADKVKAEDELWAGAVQDVTTA